MKLFIRIIQAIVGLLFIISGLVKANDPLGLGYKMQEFFELWNTGLKEGHFFARDLLVGLFNFLHDHALALSIFMISLEIVTGVALLTGWMKKFILYLLLFLIIFFTFLTGYAYLSGKFTNCGCFGDCLPITPVTSFIKDLLLLAMIVLLLLGQKYIRPFFTPRFRNITVIVSLAISILLQWYALTHLPPADCLPFKKGNNIAEQMKPPPGAVSDSTAIRYIYEKDGKRFEWSPEQLPADFESYTYVDRIDRLVRKGNAEPRIKGFSLTDTSGADHTTEVLDQPTAILIFALDIEKDGWLPSFKQLAEDAGKKNVPVYLATFSQEQFMEKMARYQVNIPVYACDFTVIRTAARTDPTVLLLKKGTIVNKFSSRQLNNVVSAIH